MTINPSVSLPFPLSFLALRPLSFVLETHTAFCSIPGSELARENDIDGSSESGCAGNESESRSSGTLVRREEASGMTGSDAGSVLLFKLRALAR